MKYGYARVSTGNQNLGMQLNALSDCDKIYKEKVSGVKQRPELISLLSKIKPGDVLKVYKLDRLGRSTIDLLNIIKFLRENDISFISVTDNIDTTTATGQLIFTVFAAFAEFERNLISERTKSGLEAIRAKGTKLGKPFKWSKEQIRQVIEMHKRGEKVSNIAKELGIPLSTVYRLLSIREQ
jgi:DNA invertase Pin-like site-specific DNA recombinase